MGRRRILSKALLLDLRRHWRLTFSGRVAGTFICRGSDDGAEHLQPLPRLVANLPLVRQLIEPLGSQAQYDDLRGDACGRTSCHRRHLGLAGQPDVCARRGFAPDRRAPPGNLRLAIIVGKISFLTLTRCLVFVRSNRWQKARAPKENSILKLGLPRRHGLRHGLLLHGLLLAGSAIAPASFWLALPSHASPCS
jgi:hypothetical protein